MKSAAVLLLFAGCLAAQQASIEGTAVNALTGEPLSGVHLRLVTGTAMGGLTSVYGAISDRAGHFSVASIRPGTYILAPDREGFLYVHSKNAESAIPSIGLKPGQHLTEYRLEMTPRAILSGRVVDENGDPIQGVTVQTAAVPPASEPLILIPVPNFGTDDRGEFRLSVPPGKYYVHARPAQGGPINDRPERRNDGSSGPIYGITYYPSAVVKDRATPVEAVGGKEVGGLEIRLARQQGLSINGTVSGVPDENGRAYIIAQFGESAGRFNSSRSTQAGADGKFTLAGAQPGYYRVWASYSNTKTQMVSRYVDLQLETSEPLPVTLVLSAGADLSGTLVVEGDPPGAPPGKRTVRLVTAGATGFSMLRMKGGEVDGDGTFHIEGIAPGSYRVTADSLPENAYVKTVELDGTIVPNGVLDLDRGTTGSRVKVTVSRNGAQISGRVLDSNGDRLLTPLVLICLMENESDTPSNGGGRANPDSTYSFKGVRPGKYRLFVVDMLQSGPNMNALDLIKKLYARGEEIEVKESDRIDKDVRVLPKEDGNAKAKQ